MLTGKPSPQCFVLNTPCSCGQYPSLPKAKFAAYGHIRDRVLMQVHGYWTCWDDVKEQYIGIRLGRLV